MLHGIKLAFSARTDKAVQAADQPIQDALNLLTHLNHWLPRLQHAINHNDHVWAQLGENFQSVSQTCQQMYPHHHPKRFALDALNEAGHAFVEQNVPPWLSHERQRTVTELRAFLECLRELRVLQSDVVTALRNKHYYEAKLEAMLRSPTSTSPTAAAEPNTLTSADSSKIPHKHTSSTTPRNSNFASVAGLGSDSSTPTSSSASPRCNTRRRDVEKRNRNQLKLDEYSREADALSEKLLAEVDVLAHRKDVVLQLALRYFVAKQRFHFAQNPLRAVQAHLAPIPSNTSHHASALPNDLQQGDSCAPTISFNTLDPNSAKDLAKENHQQHQDRHIDGYQHPVGHYLNDPAYSTTGASTPLLQREALRDKFGKESNLPVPPTPHSPAEQITKFDVIAPCIRQEQSIPPARTSSSHLASVVGNEDVNQGKSSDVTTPLMCMTSNIDAQLQAYDQGTYNGRYGVTGTPMADGAKACSSGMEQRDTQNGNINYQDYRDRGRTDMMDGAVGGIKTRTEEDEAVRAYYYGTGQEADSTSDVAVGAATIAQTPNNYAELPIGVTSSTGIYGSDIWEARVHDEGEKSGKDSTEGDENCKENSLTKLTAATEKVESAEVENDTREVKQGNAMMRRLSSLGRVWTSPRTSGRRAKKEKRSGIVTPNASTAHGDVTNGDVVNVQSVRSLGLHAVPDGGDEERGVGNMRNCAMAAGTEKLAGVAPGAGMLAKMNGRRDGDEMSVELQLHASVDGCVHVVERPGSNKVDHACSGSQLYPTAS